MLMVIGHVAASATESLGFTQLSIGHVRLLGSEVDGPMTLHELHRTMHLRHAADGRPGQGLGKTAGLRQKTNRLIFDYCQILP